MSFDPLIWSRLPNEPTLSKARRSPPGVDFGEPTPYRPQEAFLSSPRSSGSSSSFSATPPSASSPTHPPVPLPAGLFLDSSQPRKASPASPHTASAPLSLYPDNAGVFSGLAFLAGRERDFGVNSFGPSSPGGVPAGAPPVPPPASQVPTPVPKSTSPVLEQHADDTQNALAEIFAGNPRPHYRPAASPRPDTHPDSARSYFSPPPPSSPNATRSRSHSTAAVLDRQSFSPVNMTSPNPSYRPSSQQPPADPQTGYRPTISSHYSSSLPANIPNPVRLGTSAGTSSSPIGVPSPRFGEGQQLSGASYGGSYGRSNGATGYDQTGWRANGLPKQASFGTWEDAEREGRGRSRGDEQQRPWGERDTPSAGSGIGLSNMSPFSRDGGRALGDIADAGGYRARRDYSLGAVGSGRKRGESVWGSSRPLREAEDEDAEDAFAAPTRSGATSRRHSVAAFAAPSRSQVGFDAPDATYHSSSANSTSNGGRSLAYHGAFGTGSSAIDDDDLAADLNSLHLNLEAHVAATELSDGNRTTRPFSHVGSMPTNFPPGGRLDTSSSRSPPPVGSRPLQSPTEFSTSGGASRFFQQQTPTASAPRSSSRFEFGNVGVTSPSFQQPQNDYGFPNSFRMGQAPPQAQVDSNRYVPSFGLAPPSPPHSFYSAPLSPKTLSAAAPTFQAFNPQPQAPSQQQQHQFFPSANGGPPATGPDLSNLGRGVPLHTVPSNAPLFLVEFKAGRKDLFFSEDPTLQLRSGDLVLVEADRGRDIGKLLKPCSVDEVQVFQQRLVEMALGQLANPSGAVPPNPAAIARMTKEFTPKKIFGKAQAVDIQLLLSKAQDEVKALALIRSKVLQKNLAMEVCDAEWQWDRRKLTFYYTSGNRVDFRELVRELFRLYKTRIWMCCLDQAEAAWSLK